MEARDVSARSADSGEVTTACRAAQERHPPAMPRVEPRGPAQELLLADRGRLDLDAIEDLVGVWFERAGGVGALIKVDPG